MLIHIFSSLGCMQQCRCDIGSVGVTPIRQIPTFLCIANLCRYNFSPNQSTKQPNLPKSSYEPNLAYPSLKFRQFFKTLQWTKNCRYEYLSGHAITSKYRYSYSRPPLGAAVSTPWDSLPKALVIFFKVSWERGAKNRGVFR